MGFEDNLLPDKAAGDVLSAAEWNLLKQMLGGYGLGPSSHVDSIGERYTRLPNEAAAARWGVLAEELVYQGEADVTLWDGDPLAETSDVEEDVKDKLLSSGESMDLGTEVKIEYISGRWWVTAAPCPVD